MPNTPDKWDITATFHDGERDDDWRQALGSETVPAAGYSPEPERQAMRLSPALAAGVQRAIRSQTCFLG